MFLQDEDEDEDHVELSINPEFPTFAVAEDLSIDQLMRIWRKPTRVSGRLLLDDHESAWSKIVEISCVIAVVLDPLFFYIPYIDEENKCLGTDNKLRIASLVLRSLTDISFILSMADQIRELILGKTYIIPSIDFERGPVVSGRTDLDKGVCTQFAEKISGMFSRTKKKTRLSMADQIRELISSKTETVPSIDIERPVVSDWEESNKGECTQFAEEIAGMFSRTKKKIAHKLPWLTLHFCIDILSVLPVPQVLIVAVFFKTRGFAQSHGAIWNFFILLQYLPRIYRIYLSSTKIEETHGFLVKSAFYFFLYILSSHVLGGFWYFFAIQRETSCWHQACMKHSICMNTISCDGNSSRNITSLDEFCPITSPDATQFNFGIFIDSLQSNNKASIDFPTKFLFSFWWALRNISSLGSNLQTSNYVWENCFAILICVIGLPLILFLIGNNVSTYMQMNIARWEAIRTKLKTRQHDISVWLKRNKIPDDLKIKIIKRIEKKLVEDMDANLYNLFNILPWDVEKDLKRFLCLKTLINEPMLKNANPRVVKMICDYLKPVTYLQKSNILQAGEPLDMMLFITQGIVKIFPSNSDATSLTGKQKLGIASPSVIIRSLTAGHSYGVEQLLRWVASPNNDLSNLPGLTENVISHSNVEGFALVASDLSKVAAKCKVFWDLTNVLNSEQIEEGMTTIAATVRCFRNQLQAPKKHGSKPGRLEI